MTAAVVQRVVHEVDARASDGLVRNMRGTPPCTVRAGKPDDLAFVCDSWVKHAHRGERKREATRHVRELLSRARSFLSVAHVPGEPDSILGWAVVEDGAPACLHYVYVRAAGRLQGTASALLGRLAQERMEYSHAAPTGLVVPRLWTLNLKRSETE